jgi:hypothetical protein
VLQQRDNLAKRLLLANPPFSTMVLIATAMECDIIHLEKSG